MMKNFLKPLLFVTIIMSLMVTPTQAHAWWPFVVKAGELVVRMVSNPTVQKTVVKARELAVRIVSNPTVQKTAKIGTTTLGSIALSEAAKAASSKAYNECQGEFHVSETKLCPNGTPPSEIVTVPSKNYVK